MTLLRSEDIPKLILELAWSLRREGERVGTSEIVEAERIIRDYMILNKTKALTTDELIMVLSSVWPPAARKKDFLKSEAERLLSSDKVEERAHKIYEEIMTHVQNIGARPGERVSLKKAYRKGKKEGRKARASYARLKRIGAITSRKGVDRLSDTASLRALALNLARRGYGSLEEALSDKALPSGRDDLLLYAEARMPVSRSLLEGLSESRLLKMGWAAFKKRDYRVQEMVSSLLRERISRGEPLRDPEGVVEYLKRTHSLTSDILINLLSNGTPVRGLGIETIADTIGRLDDDLAGYLIAKYRKILSREEYRDLISQTEPRKLWSVSGRDFTGQERSLVDAASNAAKAYREARAYAESLNQARADMASYYADKAEQILQGIGNVSLGRVTRESIRSLVAEARQLIALVDGLGSGMTARDASLLLYKLDLGRSIIILRTLYRSTSDPLERDIIVKSMEKLLARASSRVGLKPTSTRVRGPSGRRLDLRRTIYNLLRMRQRPLIFEDRAKSRPLILVLDTSSSMIDYSAWAIAVSSMFARHIEKLVFFSHKVQASRGPFTKRELAKLLLGADFGGRTNISEALRRAAEHASSRLITVVSDLAQTVDDEPPWRVASALRRSGFRLVFITHERHDREARRLLEAEGAKVFVARSPRDAGRQMLSILR